MPAYRPHQRNPLAVAMEWVTQITTISLEMSLPAAGGYWLDKRWGTSPWITIVGAALGFYVAMKHLLALSEKSNRQRRNDRPDASGRIDESPRSRAREDGRQNE